MLDSGRRPPLASGGTWNTLPPPPRPRPLRDRPLALRALAAGDRAARRAPADGREGGAGPARRLPAQAQQLRPRGRHRARGRGAAAPLRAPRGARGGGDERHGTGCSAPGPTSTCSAPRPTPSRSTSASTRTRRGSAIEDASAALRAQVAGRGERGLRGRRLRAGPGLRRDPARRRRLVRGQPARGAAPGRAPGDGRPHARGRQAQGAARPGRRVLEPRRRREGQARGAVGAGGRDGAALEVPGAGRGARRSALAERVAGEEGTGGDARAARGHVRRRAASSTATSRCGSTPASAGGARSPCGARRAASRPRRGDARARQRAVGPARVPRARRRAPRPALQPSGDRRGGAADARRRGARARPWTRRWGGQGRLVRERGAAAHEARPQAPGPDRAHVPGRDRRGLVLRGLSPGAGPGRGPVVHAGGGGWPHGRPLRR